MKILLTHALSYCWLFWWAYQFSAIEAEITLAHTVWVITPLTITTLIYMRRMIR